MTIFETAPFGSPSATNWDCRVEGGWVASTVYRNVLAAVTKETTICKSQRAVFRISGTASMITRIPSQSCRIALMCTRRDLDATGSPTTTTSSGDVASFTSSSTSTSTPAASDSGESQAWIAGAVVGPIAGLALCAAAFWLRRRRRNHHDRHLVTEHEAHSEGNDAQQVSPQTGLLGEQPEMATTVMPHGESARETHASELDSARKPHEWISVRNPHELDSERKPYELDSARKPHELP